MSCYHPLLKRVIYDVREIKSEHTMTNQPILLIEIKNLVVIFEEFYTIFFFDIKICNIRINIYKKYSFYFIYLIYIFYYFDIETKIAKI